MNSKIKKILIICLSTIFVLIMALVIFSFNKKIKAVEPVNLSEFCSAQDINLIAHRGFSAQAPENTLPAIELAAKNRYNCVEFDIQITKDDVWVLSHDDKINRMTNGTGKIKNYTFFDLADFNINNGANYKNYNNLKMPSVDIALETCLKNDLKPMIEIKNYTDNAINRLVDTLINYGFEKSCYIISFDYSVLEKIHSINPNIELVYIVKKLDKKHLAQCMQNPEIAVSFKAKPKHNSKEKIEQLIENGNNLFCWTVDNKTELEYYYESGVKNFVTNRIIP